MPTHEFCWMDWTAASAAENLACDEALLDDCEERGRQWLRFYEPSAHFVVVGYANRVSLEVDAAGCESRGVPIHRRCTGGGTVLQGPGCLNYALALRIPETGPLLSIAGTNRHVLERNRAAIEAAWQEEQCARGSGLSDAGPPSIEILGHSDLVWNGRKFSGNAQRRKRRALLFHGSILCRFDLPLIEACLRFPSQSPEYRGGRSHADFLVNIPLSPERIKRGLLAAWAGPASGKPPDPPSSRLLERIRRLTEEKYGRDDWNRRF